MSSDVTKLSVNTSLATKQEEQSQATPRLRRRNLIEIWIFAIPALLLQLVWGWYPLVMGILTSFTDAHPILPSKFIGLESYFRVLRDPLVSQAFQVTLIYAALSILLTYISPILIAILLMEMPTRVMRWMMLLWFLPLSTIASTVLWRYIYDNNFGILQYIVTDILHLPEQRFLQDPNTVVFWLIFPGLLFFGPGLIYMASLQGIPNSYYEAAEVEGASFWRKIWSISFPRLRPIIAMTLTLSIIGSLQTFEWPQLMTGGHPSGASRTVVMYLYEYITSIRYGDATTLAVYLFVLIMVLVVLFRIFFKEDPDA